VVAEALGLALPHSALAPSGQDVWLEIARQSARAVMALDEKGITARDILTDKAIENAMVVHAAFGGSTNLLLHIPPSPMRPNAVCRTWRTGAPSTAACRAW
jgi:dihydroxyacid dehydratase/phosphogluconate dehydratase